MVLVVVVKAFHCISNGPWQKPFVRAPSELRHESPANCVNLVHEVARNEIHRQLFLELPLIFFTQPELDTIAEHLAHPLTKLYELSRIVAAVRKPI